MLGILTNPPVDVDEQAGPLFAVDDKIKAFQPRVGKEGFFSMPHVHIGNRAAAKVRLEGCAIMIRFDCHAVRCPAQALECASSPENFADANYYHPRVRRRGRSPTA